MVLGNVFEGVTMLHNVDPPNMVKFMVKKVHIGDVAVPMPTNKVINLAQTFQRFVF